MTTKAGFNSNAFRIFNKGGVAIFEKKFKPEFRHRWTTEVSSYQWLQTHSADFVPRLLDSGHLQDGGFFIHIAAVQAAVQPKIDTLARARAVGRLMKALHALPPPQQGAAIQNHGLFAQSGSRTWLADLGTATPLLQHHGVTANQLESARTFFARFRLPARLSLLHRDLRWDNLVAAVDGKWYLIDWEMAAVGPAPLDLVRFLWLESGMTDETTKAFLEAYAPEWPMALVEDMKLCFIVEMAAYFARLGNLTVENKKYLALLISHWNHIFGP